MNQLKVYLGMLDSGERQLAEGFRTVAEHHGDEPDVKTLCQKLARWSDAHMTALAPFIERYGEAEEGLPEKVRHDVFQGPRQGGLGLLFDLQALWLLAQDVKVCWLTLDQAARALRDKELTSLGEEKSVETDRQIMWVRTRLMNAAPQALVAPAG